MTLRHGKRVYLSLGFTLVLACGANEAPTESQVPAPNPTPESAAPETDRTTETLCSVHSDCVVGRDQCSREVGVHTDRAQTYEAQMAELRSSAECEPTLGVSHSLGESVAYCFDGECRAASSAYRCSTKNDCVVVGGVCGMVDVIHRDFAASLQEQYDRRAAVMSCSAHSHAPALVADCAEGLCTRRDVGNQELRLGCRRPTDCIVLDDPGCGDYLVVHRRKRRQAETHLQELASVEDCEPGEPTPRPEPACVNRYCVRAP